MEPQQNRTIEESIQTDPGKGLTSEEVKIRLERYGYNEVPEKRNSFLKRLGKRFWGVVPWMLEITAAITLVLGKYGEFVIVLSLLVFNTGMSLLQERRSRIAMRALKQGLTIHARVIRDAKWSLIPAKMLVPGDIIRIRTGDLLPADVRLREGDLSVDQSSLTGESVLVEKSKEDMVYSSSTIKRGEATGVVIATGRNTYSGRTVELLKLAKPKLHSEEVATNMTRWLAAIVAISLAVAFVYAILAGFSITVLLPLAVILSISVVPVALPTLFSMNMALGSLELAKNGVLVTRPSAVEDIAAMDVICTDKTGTMTQNKLFISATRPWASHSERDILTYGALASNTSNQDPIDISFIETAKASGVTLDNYSQLNFVPFDAKTRLTKAKVKSMDEASFSAVKGAVNAVMSSCTMSNEDKAKAEKEVEDLTSYGMRVIAVAKEESGEPKNVELIGFAGIADKLRGDTKDIISKLREQGVSVKMLTGDALPVAIIVGKSLGMDKIVRIEKETESQKRAESLGEMIENSDGIAEIYPEDKYAIVRGLQTRHHIVGMMGDGVNDAPALKQAEVGIAVHGATDTAKDSASVVLTAEGLGAVPVMVATGRMVHQRIFSWLLAFVTMKIRVVEYIVAMVILSRIFVISVYSMVLLMIMTDFATMSISTDRPRYSARPGSFDISWLFKVGVPIGVLALVEAITITFIGFNYFGVRGLGETYTFAFEYLVLSAVFNLISVRERSYFWKSRPTNILIVTTIIEILIVAVISMLGFSDLAPIGYTTALILGVYVMLMTFLVNDPLKVYLISRFHKEEYVLPQFPPSVTIKKSA